MSPSWPTHHLGVAISHPCNTLRDTKGRRGHSCCMPTGRHPPMGLELDQGSPGRLGPVGVLVLRLYYFQ